MSDVYVFVFLMLMFFVSLGIVLGLDLLKEK